MKTRTELRKFGLVLGLPLAVIGGFLLWRGSRLVGPIMFGFAVFLLVAGLLFPRLLGPVERVWMAFAEKLGVVMTHVILGLTFYLVMTPLGVLLRLMGKDLLQISKVAKKTSYWTPLDQEGSATRVDKPY